MSFVACSTCLSIRVYPYMGFMTGQQYQCQDCETISPMVIEFDTEEDFNAFLQERLCLLYTSPSPRDRQKSRMPSSA